MEGTKEANQPAIEGNPSEAPRPVWRKLSVNDIETLTHIASQLHPSLPEAPEIFTERITLFPGGCLGLFEPTTTPSLCGYLISHPIKHHHPPSLNTLLLLHDLPSSSDADQYYIHDIAILPKFQGRGFAREGVTRVLETVAKRYRSTCLVAVYGTQGFWGRFGFGVGEGGEGLREKVRGYGDEAVFLERENARFQGAGA
ncbi:MAG: hypothetical protein M1836_004080 [Candelina mexicana]|nr:MAG: hypothetical protein M1836_004080 [Candelina mexicana]